MGPPAFLILCETSNNPRAEFDAMCLALDTMFYPLQEIPSVVVSPMSNTSSSYEKCAPFLFIEKDHLRTLRLVSGGGIAGPPKESSSHQYLHRIAPGPKKDMSTTPCLLFEKGYHTKVICHLEEKLRRHP